MTRHYIPSGHTLYDHLTPYQARLAIERDAVNRHIRRSCNTRSPNTGVYPLDARADRMDLDDEQAGFDGWWLQFSRA
jgi:hypothetical protein